MIKNKRKKQLVRLAEGDLHRIIKESVNGVLREMDYSTQIVGDSRPPQLMKKTNFISVTVYEHPQEGGYPKKVDRKVFTEFPFDNWRDAANAVEQIAEICKQSSGIKWDDDIEDEEYQRLSLRIGYAEYNSPRDKEYDTSWQKEGVSSSSPAPYVENWKNIVVNVCRAI